VNNCLDCRGSILVGKMADPQPALTWLNANQGAVQALSSIVTAIVTIFLFLITSVYVRATLRSTKAIEADLKFRTKPLPNVAMTKLEGSGSEYRFKIEVTTLNAPLRFRSLAVKFEQEDKHEYKLEFPVAHFVLRLGEMYESEQGFYPGTPVQTWRATLIYTDLANLRSYEARFSSWETHLHYEEELLPLRIRSHRQD
jgi:hypothetical protein